LLRSPIQDLPRLRAKAAGPSRREANIDRLSLQLLIDAEDVEVQVGLLAVAGVSAEADQLARSGAN